MKVVSTRKQKDGSLILNLSLDVKEYAYLMRAGIQLVVGPKFKVVTIDEAEALGFKSDKVYNITDEEADGLVRLAIIGALRRRIAEGEKSRKKAKKVRK